MNKTLKTASIVTAGVVLSSISALAVEGGAKYYTLSAGLRGFYDDNVYTGNNKVDFNGDGIGDRRKYDSFGMEVTPGVRFSVPLEQTTLSAGATYGLRYFADRPGSNKNDQFFLADVQANHRFNDNHSVVVADRFALAQDPKQTLGAAGGGSSGQVLRAEGNNLNNVASVDFTSQLSPLWSSVVGYRNGYYDYRDPQFKGLNRIENLPSLGLRYQVAPTAVVSGNYQFSDIKYDDAYSFRDSRSHYAYAGWDQTVSPRLNFAVRLGVQMIDWVNATSGGRTSAANPYADASVTYTYAPTSTVQAGIRHGRNATDITATLDQRSTSFYAALNHQITGDLRATLSAQHQMSDFVGSKTSVLNGVSENMTSLGLTLSYRINAYLSAEGTYFFDDLDSGVLWRSGALVAQGGAPLRSYTRNRVFLGFRASF